MDRTFQNYETGPELLSLEDPHDFYCFAYPFRCQKDITKKEILKHSVEGDFQPVGDYTAFHNKVPKQ